MEMKPKDYTTMIVKKETRKRIKKIAGAMDVTQNGLMDMALDCLEKKLTMEEGK